MWCGENSRWAHVLAHTLWLTVIFNLFLLFRISVFTSCKCWWPVSVRVCACLCVCTRWSVSEVRISLVPWHNGAKRIASEPTTPPPSFPLTSQLLPSLLQVSGSVIYLLNFWKSAPRQESWGELWNFFFSRWIRVKYDCFVCVRLHVCSGCDEPRAFVSLFFSRFNALWVHYISSISYLCQTEVEMYLMSLCVMRTETRVLVIVVDISQN